ncbi:hypothetical protein ACFE04_007820 [Oxalis oulophora]
MSGTENVQATQKYITSFDARRLAKLPEHRMCLPPVHYQSTKSERSVRISSFSWIAITYALILGETPLHMPSKKGCNKAARRRLAHGVVLAAKANVCDNNAGECYEENNSFEKDDPVAATRLKMPVFILRIFVYQKPMFTVCIVTYLCNLLLNMEEHKNIFRDRPSGKAFLTTPLKLLCSHHLRVFLTFQVYKSKITARVG